MKNITSRQGEEAFEIHQQLLKLKEELGIRFLMMGKLLKEIRDNNYFQVLGYDNFTSYVVNSELGFKRSTAYGYICLYEWFVEKLGYDVQRIGHLSLNEMTRVMTVLKSELEGDEELISNKVLRERSDELLTEVKDLRPVDFVKKYKDNERQEGHEDYLAPPEYFRCSKCGKWILVVPIEDCCQEFLTKFKNALDKGKTLN